MRKKERFHKEHEEVCINMVSQSSTCQFHNQRAHIYYIIIKSVNLIESDCGAVGLHLSYKRIKNITHVQHQITREATCTNDQFTRQMACIYFILGYYHVLENHTVIRADCNLHGVCDFTIVSYTLVFFFHCTQSLLTTLFHYQHVHL